MPAAAAKPVIFISYSHRDEPEKPGPDEVAWLTFVQSFLAPVVKVGIFDLWVDQHLHGGDALDPEIKVKLAACDILVLLTSRYSLASTYVVETEIATMRQRLARGEDVHIFPIVLSPVPNAALNQLKDLVLRPKDAKPLSLMSKNEREVAMAEIADDIATVAERLAQKKAAKAVQLLEDHGAAAALAGAAGTHVSNRLPETPYERLVGRGAEVKRLDEAWTDPKINIISLIAEGGAGKSALVNEWLTRLHTDNYRGAEAVLGWSFYSQGTKERATSAEEFLNWGIGELGIKIETTSTTAKGEKIAEELARRRVLLVLDGVEPLQHGPGLQIGQLKDLGLRALLRRFAATPALDGHGLIVLTSRLAVEDIKRWRDGSAPVIDVDRLSDAAGAALLRDNSVWGTDKELEATAHAFDGHPLALGLLASFLKETQTGDVRRRDHIRAYFADPDNPRHDHARRVMESYEREWLAGQPVLHAIMHIVGLFDRPASADCLKALRVKPTIEGLTDAIINLGDDEWERAVARLREVRLLAPPDATAPDALDAHPLVREWFGERLRQTNDAAWKAAHGRLYEHLRDRTHEGVTPTLEHLAPLYQAIAHGCRASRHKDALEEIYRERICRRLPNGELQFYAHHNLGAISSNLSAISAFFEQPYVRPVATLSEADKTWIQAEAASGLRAQGRFAEALLALRSGLPILEARKDWANAAIRAGNLSQVELLAGEVAAAVTTAKRSVPYAERSGDKFSILVRQTVLADALHAAGQSQEASRLFADAEQQQKEQQPAYHFLYSLRGYQYCDLLLAVRRFTVTRDRANVILKWAKRTKALLDIALGTLTLGRAHVGLALTTDGAWAAARGDDIEAARARLDEAVDGLRSAGTLHHIPRALVARAAFRRSVGDRVDALRDLDEVEEIAEPGPMRLFLCDMALERARLAFAKIEAFAPLDKDKPSKATVPRPEEIAQLKAEAEKQLRTAADYIEKCGYHRRDEELAELQAVLRGEKTFASLPPRV
jgi:hypothetical protein